MDDYSKRLGKKRLRFRDWLIDKLNSREIEGVQWIDRERGLFRIPWVHGSHRTWNRNDAEIFRQWAIYSGKYEPTRDKPDPRKWKTNFRCTLNGLRDFKEVRNESSSRGPRRFKVYSLEIIGKEKKEQIRRQKEEKQAGSFDFTDKEIVQMVDEMTAPEPNTRPALQKPLSVTRARPNAAYPAFETLVMGKSTGMSLFPYTPWFLAAWNAMAVDQHGKNSQTKNVEKFADESAVKESGSQGRAEGIQTNTLLRRQKSREIRNRKRPLTEEELAYDQGFIDLIDRIVAAETDRPDELDGTEESNEADDGEHNDQEIIDLVDQMEDQNSSSLDELDGEGGSDKEEDEEPNDQEIIDLVDQMSDENRSSFDELDGEKGSDEEDEEPNDQEIIDLVDQMEDQNSSSLDELDGEGGSDEKEDEEPNDQEIIDLVDQMEDQNSSSLDELDGEGGSDEKACNCGPNVRLTS